MQLPLFIITGASGAGKTAVVPYLQRLLPACDVFDMDIILDPNDWRVSHRNWFRIARSLAEQGRPVVLCGTVIPEYYTGFDEASAFSAIHFINLHCDDAVRDARLRARGWSEGIIDDHRKFASWLLDNAATAFDPPMVIVDTGANTFEEVAALIAQWVQARLEQTAAPSPSASPTECA